MPLVVRKKVIRWGNGFGIRLTKREFERLQIHAGDEVDAEIFSAADLPNRSDLERLAIIGSGGAFDTTDLDDVAEEDALDDL